MLVAWAAAYAFTVPLYHAGASHPVWALYPANAPLMIVGAIAAGSGDRAADQPERSQAACPSACE